MRGLLGEGREEGQEEEGFLIREKKEEKPWETGLLSMGGREEEGVKKWEGEGESLPSEVEAILSLRATELEKEAVAKDRERSDERTPTISLG